VCTYTNAGHHEACLACGSLAPPVLSPPLPARASVVHVASAINDASSAPHKLRRAASTVETSHFRGLSQQMREIVSSPPATPTMGPTVAVAVAAAAPRPSPVPGFAPASFATSPELRLIPRASLGPLVFLNQGASGYVYRSTWTRADGGSELVVVKIPIQGFNHDQLRELQVHTTLPAHPQVLAVLGLCVDASLSAVVAPSTATAASASAFASSPTVTSYFQRSDTTSLASTAAATTTLIPTTTMRIPAASSSPETAPPAGGLWLITRFMAGGALQDQLGLEQCDDATCSFYSTESPPLASGFNARSSFAEHHFERGGHGNALGLRGDEELDGGRPKVSSVPSLRHPASAARLKWAQPALWLQLARDLCGGLQHLHAHRLYVVLCCFCG
jgi:hypothetical protein